MGRKSGRKGKKNEPTYKRYIRYASTAQKALSIAKSVAELINVEHKENIKSAQNIPITTGGTMIGLSLIEQGTGHYQRNGMSIKLRSIFGRAHFIRNTSSGSNVSVRMIMFIDHQTNGVVPAVTDILNSMHYLSPLNSLYGRRFRVICDEMLSLGQGSSTNEVLKCYRKLDHHMEFKGTAATSSSISKGAVFLLLISNELTNPPTCDYNFKLRFIDN